MTPLETLLRDLNSALTRTPSDPLRTLRARAWAARALPPPPLRAPRRPPARELRALERASARLLERVDEGEPSALRISAPRVADLVVALRAGPRREPWIRELLEHAVPALGVRELERAVAGLDPEQARALAMLVALS